MFCMKAAIFDMDGTLLDSMPAWDGVAEDFLCSLGIHPPADLQEQIKTFSFAQTADYFLQRFSLPFSTQEIADGIYRRLVQSYRETVPLKPYALDYLQLLQKRRIKSCILTASPVDLVYPALDRLQLWPYFDFVLTCDELQSGKEDKQTFLKTAARLGYAPSEIVVFEDALHAAKTAKAAGFPVIGLYDQSIGADDTMMGIVCDQYLPSFYPLLQEE